MIAQPGLNQKQLKRIKQGKPDKGAQRETREFIEFLKPKTGFFFTPILTYLNVGIYLLMVILGYGFFNFEADDLIDWGANYGPLTKDGEWWRLLTSTMLHGGFMHIIANGVGLLFVGIFLEPILGKIRFLLVYLSAGILGSLASIWWYDATVSVGASGAVFGLYGIFLALMLTKVTPAGLGKTLLVSTSIFILFNLLMGLTGGIDNAAHIGGLVTGFLLGLLFYPSLKGKFDEEDTNDFN